MPEAGTIRIACIGAATAPWDKLIPFQGGLKDLGDEQAKELRKQILTTGFSAPLIVWRNDAKLHVMDGHQRLEVIRRMVQDEGFKCPPLPVDWVEAISIQEAYRKCLSFSANYGSHNQQGIYEMMKGGGLQFDDVAALPFDIDMGEFKTEYFGDITNSNPGEDDPPPNLDNKEDPPVGPTVTCPKCGNQFEG